MIQLIIPVPLADFLDRVIAGQIKMERSYGDVTLAQARHVGLWSLEVVWWVVGHPIVCAPTWILPSLETLAVTSQSHRDNTDASGFAPSVRRQVDIEERSIRRPVVQNLLDDPDCVLRGMREIKVLGKLKRNGDARDLEKCALNRRRDGS